MISADIGGCVRLFSSKHACFAFSQLNCWEKYLSLSLKEKYLVFYPCVLRLVSFLSLPEA